MRLLMSICIAIMLFAAPGMAPAAGGGDTAAFPNPLPGWAAGKVRVTETKEDLFTGPVDDDKAAQMDPLGIMLITRRMLTREYTAATSFPKLAVDKQWKVWAMDRPDGSLKELFVMTQKKNLIFYYDLIFLGDFDGDFKKYQKDISSIIANTLIEVESVNFNLQLS